MKIYFLLVTSLFFCLRLSAQTNVTVGGDVSFGTKYSPRHGLGATVHLDSKISQHVGFRIYTGFINYFSYFEGDNTFLFPIRFGIRRSVYKTLFVYAEAGLGFYEGRFIDEKGFTYAFGAGYPVPISSNKHFVEVSAFFNSMKITSNSNYNWINVRIAYGLELKKKNSNKS